MRRLTFRRAMWTCAVLAAVLVGVVVLALKVGAVPISVSDLVLSLGRVAIGRSAELPSQFQVIVFGLRLPRILLAILVGAALSVAGAIFQALLRNPLADPYVLGVSIGAAVGAILALIFAPEIPLVTPAASFAGAALTIAAVYFLGRREGQLDGSTLLLGGIITASFLSAVIMFLMTTLAGRDLRGMSFWLMGDLSTQTSFGFGRKIVEHFRVLGFDINPLSDVYLDLFGLLVVVGIAAGAIYSTAADLNLLQGGENEAVHLGVEVRRVKIVVYVAASILTGLAVSVSGAIGYVGLLVPHAMRWLVGSDYRVLIPASALGGAIAVLLADTLARTIAAPTELPVGAMTAMAGAPVFIYLLRRGMR